MSAENTLYSSTSSIDLNNLAPIQVFIRIKPNNSNDQHETIPFKYSSNNKILTLPNSSPLSFDNVFPPQSTQYDIFELIIPLLHLPLYGYNSTIFAYGQTNSGKTYTMLGPNGKLSLADDSMGIIPRTSRYLFAAIYKLTLSSSSIQYQVRVSYLEVYNGRVYDLLTKNTNNSNNKLHSLSIREDSQSNITVTGAVEIPVHNSLELENVLMQGNQRRATAFTYMNSSSSRSHALLIVWIERRERSTSSSLTREYTSYLGRLNLIDLAGSEDISRSKAEGDRFREAVNINTELLQLRRVLDALSASSSYIPYRDSTLTRLLQSSLSTTQSITILISHISSLNIDLSETLSTLKYSQIAKCIQRTSIPAQKLCKNIDTSDVMFGDYNDPVQCFYRRTVYIHTRSYGKIFARIAGPRYDEQQKCILLIHGSGPVNSSIYWNDLVKRLLLATSSSSSPSPYYFVAIDSPGYGRSDGNKQTIRSYPGAFIQEIIDCISPITHQVYCLIGSSQGAAAAFNALVEKPALSSFLAVQDPVSHDPQRFVCIKQPTLLMYDIDDNGHPVSVGRLVKRYIPNNHYYEFASSKQPNWLEHNRHLKLLQLFNEYDANNNNTTNASSLQLTLPACVYEAGGIISYLSSYNREPLYQSSREELESILSAYENQSVQNDDLFVEKIEPERIEDDESKAQRLATELAQTQCDLCNQHISSSDMSKSLRLSDCRHLLCYSCCCETIKLNSYECPIVGCAVKVNIPSSQLSLYSLPFSSQNEKHILIQFGNSCKSTSSSSSQRYEYTAYVKCNTTNVIDSVSFDINPEYPKSAIRVSKPPYELVRIMNSEFTCDFIIEWNKMLNWPKLRITYYVQNKQHNFTRNLLVRLSNQGNTLAKSHKTRQEVVYNWIDRDRTKPSVNYVIISYDI
jgi:predicted esterase